MTELFPLLLIGAVMYFVAFRPQQKRQQQVKAMLANLAIDDDVITIGGMYGTVVDQDEHAVDLRVSASGLVLRFQKGAIATVVPDVDESALEASSVDEASAEESSDAPAMLADGNVVDVAAVEPAITDDLS